MSYSGLTFANLQRFDPRPVPILRAIGEDSQLPRRAIEALRRGQAVVFSTHTVYGLGCRIDDEDAVRRIYAIKGRALTEPPPVLLADPIQVQTYTRGVHAAAQRLISRFWPGALTLVFLRSDRIPPAVAGGGETVGLRVPAHPLPPAAAAGPVPPTLGPTGD